MKKVIVEPYYTTPNRFSVTIKCSNCNEFNTVHYSANPQRYPSNASALINMALKTSCPFCSHSYSSENLSGIMIKDKVCGETYTAELEPDITNAFMFSYQRKLALCWFTSPLTKETKFQFTLPDIQNRISDICGAMFALYNKYLNKNIVKSGHPKFYQGHINHNRCDNDIWKFVNCQNNIITLKCVACGEQIYVVENDVNRLLSPRKDLSKIRKQINTADVIVLSSDRHCSSEGHKTMNVFGIIPVKERNGIIYDKQVYLSYCLTCQRYTLRTSEYLKLNGVPTCTVKDLRTNKIIHKVDIESDFNLSPESVMKKYGYTVKFGSGLSVDERRRILIRLIEDNILTRGQVCDHLQYLISLNDGKVNYESAVSKWRSDLDFIQSYKFKTDRGVIVSSLTIKGHK